MKRPTHRKKWFLHLALRKDQLLYRQKPPQRACDLGPQAPRQVPDGELPHLRRNPLTSGESAQTSLQEQT